MPVPALAGSGRSKVKDVAKDAREDVQTTLEGARVKLGL